MFKIDLFSSKKALEGFILFQFTIVMISILLSYKLAYSMTHIIEQNIVLNLLLGIIGFAVVYFLHEFIHNIMFRMFAKGNKPTYRIRLGLMTTHMPNVYFKKWQYISIMLAPLVIITSALFVLFSFFAYSSLIFIACFHIGYCVLDLYFLSGAFNKNVQLIEDTEDGIIFYTKASLQDLQTEAK
ncbi:DUF3267 domain-containing protein [Staphylococcus pseudoxylosus]|uniref:DUF3267 domain-containing protein n=1 Tax=Staphylococcus pseudoxylosus TaxID=2282419 RepID=UPI002DBB3458|nr:DUF3267 domain-containing protein [Staphylococcus pseudoxylosus]MEB6062009.1 DUF3267 domain-containing protein [Staphylococcus pseudoxylosus]